MDARTAVEIGTSSQPSAPKTIRSQVSRSVAGMYSSGPTVRKSSLRAGVAREHLVQVLLDAGAGVRARREPLGEPEHEVHRRDLAQMAGDAAQQLRRAQRQREGAAREAADVRAQEVAEIESGNGVGRWRSTTRIISSGVTPLATIEATNEPALVPT